MAHTTFPAPEPSSARHRPVVRPMMVALAVAVAFPAGALGCGSSTPDQSGPASSSAPGDRSAASATTLPEGQCVTRMPGQILRPDEAVVQFSPSQVCPGYVTVAPGTPVTFKNLDTAPHTITITEGNTPGGRTVANGTAPAGQTWVQTFDTAGTFIYATDAIPSFRGTVDVTTGSGSH